jgi:uncharacterized membrane protein
MSLTISPSLTLAQEQVVKHRTMASIAGIPLYTFAVTLASLCTIIGIMWDISWHTTIGRDAFLSPPHLLIYLGAIFGGLFSGIQVLWSTFAAPAHTKKTLVKVWGFFYSSLGALFCIWGAVAMLTSAPFDDWWHNAYGLDVVILSPPHSLLGLGMLFLQFGACVSTSKYLNKVEADIPGNPLHAKQKTILRTLFIIAAASLLCMICVLATDYIDRRSQRTPGFYEIATIAILLFLPAFGRELRMKFGMTYIALAYFFIIAITNWVLQMVPAVPKLGPILNPVTHLQSLQFPLLLFVPALAMDLVMAKTKGNDWVKAALISVVFVSLLLAVQYPFSGFLLESPGARNWFFGSESWYYGASPDWKYRYKFQPESISTLPALLTGLGISIVAGFLTARLSLRWGKWLQTIQR